MDNDSKKIILSFDVEDWFQVENFKPYIPRSSWNNHELRVVKNTIKILEILDGFPFKPKATFFILGWLREKTPNLVREIADQGHEVASHGFDHKLCLKMEEKELLQDLITSKKGLEDLTGKKISGYRAPSFAINNRILEIINKAEYSYDSSFNNFSMHGRYGSLDLENFRKCGSAWKINNNFYELPLSNINIGSKVFPMGGGGYFRLIPIEFFKLGIKKILKNQDAYVFYAHPWEFDPDQPRVTKASPLFKFRHYINLGKTEEKFSSMLKGLRKHDFLTCRDYIENIMTKKEM